MELKSEKRQEVEAGKIVTIAVAIGNSSEELQELTPYLDLPQGWIALPLDPKSSLAPHARTLQLIAIKIPKKTRAQEYQITYQINPETKTEWIIKVLPFHEVQLQLQELPSRLIAGSPYTCAFNLLNSGNVTSTIDYQVRENLGYPLLIEPEGALTLEPGESATVSITVKTDPSLEIVTDQYLFIDAHIRDSYRNDLKNRECEPAPQNFEVKPTLPQTDSSGYFGIPQEPLHETVKVEIFPQPSSDLKLYQELSMKSVFGYGQKNGKKQLFVEQYGSGFVDPEKGKELALFFHIPILNQASINRDLGGPQENFYLHYSDKTCDLYAGDGIYQLTPLLMNNLYGRGGSISLGNQKIALKAVGLKNSSSVPQSNLGAHFFFAPSHHFNIKAASIKTLLNQESALVFQTNRRTFSNSLFADLHYKKAFSALMEYGKTGAPFTKQKNQYGYYIYARGNARRGLWYAVQKIYASPEFVGYYHDTDQLYASLGLPLFKGLRANVAHQQIKNNLNRSFNKQTAARNLIDYIGISYSFPSGLYTSLYANKSAMRNALTGAGIKTLYASLNGAKRFDYWTLQGMVDYGQYDLIGQTGEGHTYQNYQFYLYYQPKSRQQYGLYSRLGAQFVADKIEWAHVYGASISYQYNRQFDLQLNYEYIASKQVRSYLNSTMRYTFSNQHLLDLKGYWNRWNKHGGNLVEYLISYTIPWKLPIKKKRSHGTICGKASYVGEDGEVMPYSNLVINCNGRRLLTDASGLFTIANLKPGLYQIGTEEGTSHSIALPTSVTVTGGESAQAAVHFDHPASVTGEILLYHFTDGNLEKSGRWHNGVITLHSSLTGEKIVSRCSENGEFFIDKLPPGRWKVTFYLEDPPPYHILEPKEQVLDLFPGDEQKIIAKLLPIRRKMEFIDEGKINSQQE